MKYFLSDIDIPYAMDSRGNEFIVGKGGKLVPTEKGTIDPYWGGITEEQALKFAA